MKTFVFVLLVFWITGFSVAEPVQHVVQDGETLYGIARRFHITLAELLDFNGIESSGLLLPGTVLSIPDDESPTYAVLSGETLYGIARKFQTTVTELRRLNNLTETSILHAGQALIVPDGGDAEKPLPEDPRTRPEIVPVSRTVAEQIPFDGGSTWPVAGENQKLDGKLPGIMIHARPGTPVQAVAAGRVVYSGPHSSFGNVVFVESGDGYIYVYGGQDTVQVRVGESVDAGSRIGTTGMLPGDGGAALYFSVWRNDEFVDPESAPRG